MIKRKRSRRGASDDIDKLQKDIDALTLQLLKRNATLINKYQGGVKK